jgi:hypothetical protein
MLRSYVGTTMSNCDDYHAIWGIGRSSSGTRLISEQEFGTLPGRCQYSIDKAQAQRDVDAVMKGR